MDRSADRLVALVSIVVAVAYLVAALGTLALPEGIRHGIWLPLHLALAGGAGSVICGLLPFFVAAFAAAPPADPRVRWAALAAVAGGAGGLAIGVSVGIPWLPVPSALTFIVGVLLAGLAALAPLRGALGPSRGMVTKGYFVALIGVVVGATVATLLLAGWTPVVQAWPRLRAAHAWLNLVGFVSLVIATTLVHFFPTLVGARIPAGHSGRFAVVGLAVGAWMVAAGYTISSDILVRAGALASLGGALAVAIYAASVWRRRARWTTDPGWHAFAIGGTWSGVGWFTVGTGILATRTIVLGADPAGWSIAPVAAPLLAGWVGIVILASGTHLLPAVGPGDQSVHAQQRAVLGAWARARLVVLNAGVAGAAVGAVAGLPDLETLAAILLGGSAGITALLIARAVVLGLTVRSEAPRTPSGPGL